MLVSLSLHECRRLLGAFGEGKEGYVERNRDWYKWAWIVNSRVYCCFNIPVVSLELFGRDGVLLVCKAGELLYGDPLSWGIRRHAVCKVGEQTAKFSLNVPPKR